MAAKVSQPGAVGKKHDAPPPRPREMALTAMRTDFGLSLSTFARMTAMPEETLVSWEKGITQINETGLARIGKVADVLNGLARVMHRSFIPTWLDQPNDACKEAGARTPLDLLERGDYGQLQDMIFYLESGVPS